MQLRSMQYRLPSASGSNDPKCVPHVESTSPVVVSTVTLVLFTLKERKEARRTKHEARSTKHEAQSTKHEAQSKKQKAQKKGKNTMFAIITSVSTRMECLSHCNHRHGGTRCIVGQHDRRGGESWQKGNAHNTMSVHVCMSSEFRLKVALLLWQCLQPPSPMAVQLLMNMLAKGR